MDEFIPVNEPLLGKREKELVLECINSGWISSEGPFVEKFEESFSKTVKRKYGVSCSSGTAALDLAVSALKIGPGDEVIMPTFTIISCASSVIKAGARPILIDADPNTWNMNVNDIEASITPKTVAIMAVHIYGLPVDMDPLLEIANRYKLVVIEDAAELIGANYKKNPCGSFGHVSTFSFYPNKQITTGEGGMVVTNDLQIRDRCKSLRNLCFQKERRFIHKELGWNYRMTNLQAALGLAQLEKLDLIVKNKIKNGKIYNQLLENVQGISTPLQRTKYAENIYWVYGILLDSKIATAEEMIEKLRRSKIGTRPFFFPMHKQPVFKEMGIFEKQSFPISEKLCKYGFYLPSGLKLEPENIEKVAEILKRLIR